jgi:hypothetical protein
MRSMRNPLIARLLQRPLDGSQLLMLVPVGCGLPKAKIV